MLIVIVVYNNPSPQSPPFGRVRVGSCFFCFQSPPFERVRLGRFQSPPFGRVRVGVRCQVSVWVA